MDFLVYVPIFWILAGLILVGLEMAIPGFIIFFFGIGGILTGIAGLIFGGLSSNFLLQIVVWLGSSVVSLFFLRKYLSKIFKGSVFDETKDTTELIGASAVVTSNISPDKPGRIKFQGTTWKAGSYTENLKQGEPVEIIAKEDSTFIVTRSILEKPDN